MPYTSAGTVYFLTAARPGHSGVAGEPRSGLYAEPPEGFPVWLRWIAGRHGGEPAVEVSAAPSQLEVQVRRKGEAHIVHLLDWYEGRDVRGVRLQVNLPGSWRAHYPTTGTPAGTLRHGRSLKLRAVRIHDMVVLEPES